LKGKNETLPIKEADMISIADESVHIQTSSDSQCATPSWLGEVALVASHFRKQGILNKIGERVRFARRRFGRYDVLDFLAVLLGYALSGERTLEAFYEAVQPFASVFMALFGRTRLPAASTLSRFLAALPAEPVEALRMLFQEDLLARRLSTEESSAGLWDRQGNRWLVFDVDGTREAARQRALPQTPDRPAPQRRLRPLCAPGYTGRKRGEIVRTRTTVLQMHTHQWVASFGNPGNGQYREELRRAKTTIQEYIQAHGFPAERTLVRLDGQYGTGAVISDLGDFAYVTRGKDYRLLDRADIQTRLHLPADQHLKSARCVGSAARSTTAQTSAWTRADHSFASLWPPTQPRQRRKRNARSGSFATESCMNSSGPSCPRAPSLPLMWCPSICTAVPLKPLWKTKTRNKSLTDGVAIRPGGRKPGRSWLSGAGTCDWSWGTSLPLNRCGPPSLRLP
jgi:hypothetical protein